MNKANPENPTYVFVTEASAGSGKTYCLAKWYLKHLINARLKLAEIPLKGILAITFTNKAALEMKERILDLLKRLALDKFERDGEKQELLDFLGVDEKSAALKAHLVMEKIIREYNYFQVQTIDSFINAILSGCAFKLDLSARFKTEPEHKEYIDYSLDNLIDKASSDPKISRLFHDFLLQYISVENAPSWFPKNQIREAIYDLFSKSNKYPGTFLASSITAKELSVFRNKIIDLIITLAKDPPEGLHKTFLNSLASFLEEDRDSIDLDELSEFFGREELPLTKGTFAGEKVHKLWDRIRSEVSEYFEMKSLSKFNYYVEIFGRILEDLKVRSSQDDVLFLEALNKEAFHLFKGRGLGLPELYLRLATNFKHFLVDEFQDTSLLQWDNLFMMVEEALATDGTLFYVGDKKQAIYRFRGGDPSLIQEVKKAFQSYPTKEEVLLKNWRSRKEIVEFNNRIFSEKHLREFLNKDNEKNGRLSKLSDRDIDEVVGIYRESGQEYRSDKPGGFVKTELIDEKKKDKRDEIIREKLLATIADLLKRFAYKDIAILARRNEQVKLLTSWLLEKGIPTESEKTLNIRENSYIKELVSFLKFLNSPIDNLSFASFIIGDIFARASGLDQEELRSFVLKHKPDKDRKEKAYLFHSFQEEYPKAWQDLIEGFYKSVGFIPLYEFTHSIYSKFAISRDFPGYQGFFMRFLEMIKEQEEKRANIPDFLEYFDNAGEDELYVSVTKEESVKIMTVHKAKGLEFPAVIVPFLEMDVKTDTAVVLPEDSQIEFDHLGKVKGLRLLYVKQKYAGYSQALEELQAEEYRLAFIDELNNVYVALTRAIDELYIFASPRTGNKANLARLLLPAEPVELGEKVSGRTEKSKKESAVIELGASEHKDWIPFLKDEFIDESLLRERDKVLRGDQLHYILSFIGNIHKHDLEALVESAIKRAQARYPNADSKDLRERIGKLLSDKALAGYFELKDGEVFTEKEIADCFGQTLRIDRLLIKESEAVVIDYKSSKASDDSYHKQVGEYMKIIREIYPKLKVRGVLIYLDSLVQEEIHG